MSTFAFRYLSPDDRRAYKDELLHLLQTRNESLAKRWGIDRANRCLALKLALEDFNDDRVTCIRGLMEQEMEREFYLAGLELLDAISKGAAV